jgi:hypothetical protein
MRAITAAAFVLALLSSWMAQPARAKTPPKPSPPAVVVLPDHIELADAQEMKIVNLQLEVVELQVRALQRPLEVAQGERQKVVDRITAKYRLDLTAGDDFEPVTLKIVRKPKKPAPPKPAPPPPAMLPRAPILPPPVLKPTVLPPHPPTR